VPPDAINVGDVIVFISSSGEPIIHRVVNVLNENGEFYYTTKGDANPSSLSFELRIPYNTLIGKAVTSAPFLGIPRVLLSYITGI
jgi:signal peptidase I